MEFGFLLTEMRTATNLKRFYEIFDMDKRKEAEKEYEVAEIYSFSARKVVQGFGQGG